MYVSTSGFNKYDDELVVERSDNEITISNHAGGGPNFYVSFKTDVAERLARDILAIIEQDATSILAQGDDDVRAAHVFPDE